MSGAHDHECQFPRLVASVANSTLGASCRRSPPPRLCRFRSPPAPYDPIGSPIRAHCGEHGARQKRRRHVQLQSELVWRWHYSSMCNDRIGTGSDEPSRRKLRRICDPCALSGWSDRKTGPSGYSVLRMKRLTDTSCIFWLRAGNRAIWWYRLTSNPSPKAECH